MTESPRTKSSGLAGTAALDKGLALLALIVRDRGTTALSLLADGMGLAQSTARRLVAALERQGLVTRAERGHYMAGAQLIELGNIINTRELLVRASRAPLRRLARDVNATAHLGILEADMVTYLIKEQLSARPIFTREREQLEAYCSGIGKVLLAHLAADEREAYLGGVPFVPLTERTIVDPGLLRDELEKVKARGYATDDAEIADGLYCVAVPVVSAVGDVVAAISVSSPHELRSDRLADLLGPLRWCAATVAARLGGPHGQI
jgi:DNA-binding IclR family transcriptional regulator